MNLKHILVISLFTITAGLAGCEQEGPAESTGEKIDNMANDVKDSMNDAAESAEHTSEEAVDAIKDTTN